MDPVLLHIGYHKTGSGWLRRRFFVDPRTGFGSIGKSGLEHPVRRLVAARPFEFDPVVSRQEFDRRLKRVTSKGLLPVVAFERLTGHPFSGGYDTKEIADRLAKTFPEGRVLVVIREQRGMILSTYNQYVREGGTWPVQIFLDPPVTKSMRMPWFDFRHFQYHHLIGYYQKLFGTESVLALSFEQFRADPASFVSRIADFVERPLDDEVLRSLPFGETSNPSPSPLAVELHRRLNRLGWEADINPTPVFTTRALARPFRRAAHSLNQSQLGPRALNARMRQRLRDQIAEGVGDRYDESNRITAELTGIDLAALGWRV